MPADIYIDDQGIDGAGTGENCSGCMNCKYVDQSFKEMDGQKLWTDDEIKKNNSSFAIGIDRNNLSGNYFNGLIDGP